MQEVDADAVDHRAVLAESVEQRLHPAPVVVPLPVVHKALDPPQRRALRPVVDEFLGRPACHVQPPPQVMQHALRYVQPHGHHLPAARRRHGQACGRGVRCRGGSGDPGGHGRRGGPRTQGTHGVQQPSTAEFVRLARHALLTPAHFLSIPENVK